MTRLKIILIYTGLLLAISCIAPNTLQAQGPGFDEDVDDTPIDGGATIMLVAAAGYGYKKIADRRKKNVE